MGQHKYNPTAIAAKEGKLPPKPKKLSKREREALLMAEVCRKIFTKTGIGSVLREVGREPYVEAEIMTDLLSDGRNI